MASDRFMLQKNAGFFSPYSATTTRLFTILSIYKVYKTYQDLRDIQATSLEVQYLLEGQPA